jgi:CTP synthase (UTP-ammonia lyase)
MEDETTKSLFTGKAKNKSVPYDFIDMLVKQPFDEKWKTNCRTRIKGCDGFIVLISKNTKNASGELWEIDCVKDEKIPMVGIYIGGATSSDKPDNMNGILCKKWTWDNVSGFIESL